MKKLSAVIVLLVIFGIAIVALAPAVSAGGIVYTEASVNPKEINLGETATVTLRAIANTTTEKRDVDVIHIIDRSGSMGWDTPTRLSCAKDAAKTFNGLLGTNDRVGLVSYSGNGSYEYITLDEHLTSDFDAVNTSIDTLIADGATDPGDAIDLAIDEITDNGRETAVKVALLLTDGMANRPFGPGHGENPADVQYALSKAEDAVENEIIIFTIGLGSDINATMLQHIADITGGVYYHAPSGGDLQEVYNSISGRIAEIAGARAYHVLPAEVEYVEGSASAEPIIYGQTLEWIIGDFAPDASWNVSFDVKPLNQGNLSVNVVPDSEVTYIYGSTPRNVSFPEVFVEVKTPTPTPVPTPTPAGNKQ